MTGTRWAFLLLLPALPACALTASVGTLDPTAAGPPAPPPAGSQFAEFPRLAPGDRVPLRDRTPDPAPPAAEPPAPGPPAVAVPPVAVPAPPPDPPLVLAVRAYLDGRPDLAVGHLKALDPATQELMLQLIPAVVRTAQTDLSRAGPAEAGELARQLDGPAAALSARAPLDIPAAYFTPSVVGFGQATPLPPDPGFAPLSVAVLYVEVKNAQSAPARVPGGDGFATELACTRKVRDATGAPVETLPRQTTRKFTRSPSRDHFLVVRVPVPARPGAYTVTVEVDDLAGKKSASKTIPFRVR